MKRYLSVMTVVVGVLTASLSWAQDGEDVPPQPPDSVQASQGESDGSDEQGAWKLLERAIDALAVGDQQAAKRYLEKLHAEYPDHPAANASAGALETLGGEQPSAFLGSPDADETKKKPARSASGEKKTGIARAELAVFQTINGLAVGAELCGVAECDDPRLIIGSLAGGAGLGLGLSLYATRNGITPGHALSLNSGTFWGFANGLALHGALDQDNLDQRRLPGMMAAGQLLGLGASQLLYTKFKPDAGDVALMNSTGLWSGVMAMLINGIAETQETQALAVSTMVAFDLGLVGGALLSEYYPMSRGRAFVIDAGGLVGSLTGVGAYLFFTDGEGESRGGFTSAVVGGVFGLGLSTFLTRKWDEDEELFGDTQFMVAPTDEGGATVGVGGRF